MVKQNSWKFGFVVSELVIWWTCKKIDSILYVFNALHFTPILIIKQNLKFNVTKVPIYQQYLRFSPKLELQCDNNINNIGTIKNCLGSKLFVIYNFILETALFYNSVLIRMDLFGFKLLNRFLHVLAVKLMNIRIETEL